MDFMGGHLLADRFGRQLFADNFLSDEDMNFTKIGPFGKKPPVRT
jgi:hypothetical protein